VEIKVNLVKYVPIGIILSFFIIILFSLILNNIFINIDLTNSVLVVNWINLIEFQSNIDVIGQYMFNYCLHYFFLIVLVLFLGLLGTIVLIV
jgi:hypothetical protein